MDFLTLCRQKAAIFTIDFKTNVNKTSNTFQNVTLILAKLVTGRSRRGATSRTQPRCSRSNQTRDQQGSEVAEQRPQRSRCLRGRRQHPCHSSRNENENLSSAERPATASTSSRRRTSTRGRPMAAENSRSRRAENREQRLESISSQSDQSSNHSGLAFRLLRRLSSAMQEFCRDKLSLKLLIILSLIINTWR